MSCDSRNSDSSGSTAPTLHHRFGGRVPVNGVQHTRSRSSIDGFGVQHSPLSPTREPSTDSSSPELGNEDEGAILDDIDGELEDEDRKMKKEAISNRKVSIYALLVCDITHNSGKDCGPGDHEQVFVGYQHIS